MHPGANSRRLLFALCENSSMLNAIMDLFSSKEAPKKRVKSHNVSSVKCGEFLQRELPTLPKHGALYFKRRYGSSTTDHKDDNSASYKIVKMEVMPKSLKWR